MPDWEYIFKLKIYTYFLSQRARQICPSEKKQNIYTVNDLINALGVYLILGVQTGAFKGERRFITVTISKKLIYFRRKYQESLMTAEYPLHQLIHLGRLEIQSHFEIPALMSESSLIVIVSLSLVYPYFKLDVEQDEIRQALLIKVESE